MQIIGQPPTDARFPFSIWFYLFAAGSLALAWFVGKDIVEAHQARNWPRVPCTIIRSYVDSRDKGEYRTVVMFRYEVNGQSHRGDALSINGPTWSSDYSVAAARVAKYPVGSTNICVVDPKDASRALLQTDVSYVGLIMMPLPMMIWAMYERLALWYWWRARRGRGQRGKPARLSEEFAASRPKRGVLWVGLMSLALSSSFILWIIVNPVRATMAAQLWRPTPCRVIESSIVEKTHHQGNSFEPHVLYSYEVNGREYKTSRFDLKESFSTSYSNLKSLLEPYQPGATNVCFVNPADPHEAVLNRGFHPDWFFGCFSIGYFALSLAITGQALFGGRQKVSQSGLPSLPNRAGESVRVSTHREALNKTILAALGMIACGVAATLLGISTIRSLKDLHIDLLPLLYLFAAIAGAGWCGKQLILFGPQLFAPRPIIEVAPGVLALGEPFVLRWKFRSSTRRVASLEFVLAAREELKVKKVVGTIHGADEQETTEKRVVWTRPLFAIHEQGYFSEGEQTLTFPADVMHSFRSPKAKLGWWIQTIEKLEKGRTFDHEFEVIVMPQQRAVVSTANYAHA